MHKFIQVLLLITIFAPASANIPTIKIGEYEWATENLAVTKFRNGDEIPQAKNLQEWQTATESYKPVWCYPDFKETNGHIGKIYNYYAINSEKKICPEGYHIPTPAEWRSLVMSVNSEGKLDAGRKLKGKSNWKTDASIESIRKNGTDDFGFNAQPGGYIKCNEVGSYSFSYSFVDLENCVSFWSNSTNGYNVALGDFNALMLTKDYSYVQMHDRNHREGYFVRYVKNDATFKELPYFSNKLFTWYYWMTENLSLKSFKNGEEIPYAKNKKEWEKFSKEKTAACCSVNFDSKNDKEFGLLYNWYAVNDSRGLAPEGWKIPNYSDWHNLDNPVKDKYPKMENWANENTWKNRKGTNESGFNGKAAGYLNQEGINKSFGLEANWWHSMDVESNKDYAYIAFMNEDKIITKGNTLLKGCGLSVRCIKE